MVRILVVGAGFAGAVYARELAEAGLDVDVIDKRDHIGGNCYDYLHSCGVRVHAYGPHLFHTSNQSVVEWLSKFTDWVPYEHKAVARLSDGRTVPIPINLDTVNAIFDSSAQTPEEVERMLEARAVKHDTIMSAEHHLLATIGPELTELFFRRYTRKMWGMELSDTDASVVRRLKVRTDREDRYFPGDSFQAMPREGYTKTFERILDHPRIRVRLREAFSFDLAHRYNTCFNSMPIDEYYGFDLGELPYRSIRFHLSEHPIEGAEPYPVINYTDMGPYTRESWWHNISGHQHFQAGRVLKTVEEPCDYRDNFNQRYYPVKTTDKRYDKLYQCYFKRSAADPRMIFIGRCGTYQYLDMHQVINQSLVNVAKWLKSAAL
jgi:UDP-galactopyranose mutase